MLPLIEIPAAPLAVNLLKALVPPTAPPNTTDPVPALTVSARGVDDESLLIVLAYVITPAVLLIDWSPSNTIGPLKLILPDVLA